MDHAGRLKTCRGVVRSVVEIAALTLDELLDSGEDASSVLLAVAPWRRRCRRLIRHVLMES
jgi:hypothetical protein